MSNCVFEKDEAGIAQTRWREGLDVERLQRATVHELFDGARLVVREGIWLYYDTHENAFKPVPLSAVALPFYEGLTNWFEGWGSVLKDEDEPPTSLEDGDYVLIGPQVLGNPYGSSLHMFLREVQPWNSDIEVKVEGTAGAWRSTWAKILVRCPELFGVQWRLDNELVGTLVRADLGLAWPASNPS